LGIVTVGTILLFLCNFFANIAALERELIESNTISHKATPPRGMAGNMTSYTSMICDVSEITMGLIMSRIELSVPEKQSLIPFFPFWPDVSAFACCSEEIPEIAESNNRPVIIVRICNPQR